MFIFLKVRAKIYCFVAIRNPYDFYVVVMHYGFAAWPFTLIHRFKACSDNDLKSVFKKIAKQDYRELRMGVLTVVD